MMRVPQLDIDSVSEGETGAATRGSLKGRNSRPRVCDDVIESLHLLGGDGAMSLDGELDVDQCRVVVAECEGCLLELEFEQRDAQLRVDELPPLELVSQKDLEVDEVALDAVATLHSVEEQRLCIRLLERSVHEHEAEQTFETVKKHNRREQHEQQHKHIQGGEVLLSKQCVDEAPASRVQQRQAEHEHEAVVQ